MTKVLNVAMIGGGFMGKAHAMAYAAMPMFFWPAPAIPHRKVVVDITDGAAEEARRRFGFDEASSDWRSVVARPDIDVVDICTPNNVHAEIAIAAAKAGKHILCEKPLALGLAQTQSMFAVARANRVMLLEAYPYYFQPQSAAMLDVLQSGAIGDIQSVQACFGFTLSNPVNNIRLNPQLGGGALLDAGSYPLSLIRLAMGCAPPCPALVRHECRQLPTRHHRCKSGHAGDGIP